MKKKNILIPISLSILLLGLSGCSKNDSNTIVLRILNMEDYIYVNDPTNGYDEPNIYDEQFIEYVRNDEYYGPLFEGKKISVVYDTTDTNETLYSSLQTGKAYYDLICPSDYMIQKLVSFDMILPLEKELIPNYYGEGSFASDYLKDIMDSITSRSYKKQEDLSVGDFAVGYMWGTLGLLFNPEYPGFSKDANPFNDMQQWHTLWTQPYKGTFSIKDSMRDTYAVGIMETFKDELENAKKQYDEGEIDKVKYNEILTEIFNRCDEASAKKVQVSLESLKANAFGLEVDSGKQDIVTGKIGLNLAWSGDAVYSMDQAEDPEQVSNPFELYYAIPEIGSNIWFDAWVMPSTSRTEDQKLLAHAFLNFLCDPNYAAKNMDYTGYTSFVGGDDILELVRDWYDYRTYEVYGGGDDDNMYSLFYKDPLDEQLYEVSYDDCHFEIDSDPDYDNVTLYYDKDEIADYDDEGNLINAETDLPLELEDLYILESTDEETGEEVVQTYNQRLILPDEIEEVNLKYFFEGTLTEYEEESDYIFYSDCYLPFKSEDGNISVGRQFFCQYPDEETITRCAVMKDYRENNNNIMKMWEEFKSDPLPLWAIILFAVEGAIILGVVALYFINKGRKKYIRKKRKLNKASK